jgi:hypothetical protein
MQTMDDAVLALLREGVVDADEAGVHLSSRDLLPSDGRGAAAAPDTAPPKPARKAA